MYVMATRKTSEGRFAFKGSGIATLTILGYQNWKQLKCNGQPLKEDEVASLQSAANYSNYGTEGVIKIEWPAITVEFDMNKFLGKLAYKILITCMKHKIYFAASNTGGTSIKPMILSTSNHFSRIMHPFAIDKEWFRGFDNKDVKNLDG